MPKFKVGDKIALAKVEYRTVLEVVEASEHEYYIKRPYRPFESSVLSHSVYDIDNNYELVKPRESETEFSTVVDPDGFDIDDPESPINALAQLQEKVEALEKGEASDGYHTHNELYEYRRAYNALLFNAWSAMGLFDVHKSKRHSDGEECLGGGWFIVVAELPTGQISNHYKLEYWDEFNIPERALPNTYDGHTPAVALKRALAAIKEVK